MQPKTKGMTRVGQVVDVDACDQPSQIVCQQLPWHRGAPLGVHVTHADRHQLEGCADPGGEVVSLRRQEPDHLAPDDPAAQQRDSERLRAHDRLSSAIDLLVPADGTTLPWR